jgi:two-component system sensor histidine kinase RegB
MARLPITSLIEEVTAPHRDFGIAIKLEPGPRLGAEPVARRNPGVLYGLGNIVENAVDFAHEKVTVRWRWDEEWVSIEVIDDGPGFPPEILDRIGEPYMTTRQTSEEGGGLGLGLFIAKTLIERSGATIRFANGAKPGMGATVAIVWPRSLFVAGGTGDTTPY